MFLGGCGFSRFRSVASRFELVTAIRSYTSPPSSKISNVAAAKTLPPGLYVVATPLGNLKDVTYRAIETLRDADVIFAEDTIHSSKLFKQYDIKTKAIKYHKFNEKSKINEATELLSNGMSIALISDAGLGKNVIPTPGPCAVITALVAAGLDTARFRFLGFLPEKVSERNELLEGARVLAETHIFYVSPHSIATDLRELAAYFGGRRRCVIAREMTKIYEEFFRSSLDEAADEFSRRSVKGEFTVLVEGASLEERTSTISETRLESEIMFLKSENCSVSTTSKILSRYLNIPRKEIYNKAVLLR